MLAEFNRLVDVDILVAEEDDTALSNEQCQVILLLVRELGELDTVDFGADLRCQIEYLFGVVVKRSFLGISTETRILVLKRFELRILKPIVTTFVRM